MWPPANFFYAPRTQIVRSREAQRHSKNYRFWDETTIMCWPRYRCMYVLYASLANVFALYIFADYCLNVILDKYVDDEPVENRYFDHIVGKYLIFHSWRATSSLPINAEWEGGCWIGFPRVCSEWTSEHCFSQCQCFRRVNFIFSPTICVICSPSVGPNHRVRSICSLTNVVNLSCLFDVNLITAETRRRARRWMTSEQW